MAAAALSALLLAACARGWLPGTAACISLVPLFLVLTGESNPFRAGLRTCIAHLGLTITGFEGALPAIPWTFPVLLVLHAPWGALPGVLLARLQSSARLSGHVWPLAPLWTACEFVAGRRWLWGDFTTPLALGYTQADGPLLGIAAYAGVGGVSFCVLLVNCGVTRFLVERRARHLAPLPVLLAGLAAVAPSPSRPAPEGPLVGVVQASLDPVLYEIAASLDAATDSILSAHLELTESSGEADLVVWPEAAVPLSGLEELPIELRTRDAEAEFLLGAITERNGKRFNSVVSVADGQVTTVFDKLVPVPIGEAGISPGGWLVVDEWAGVSLAPLVCLDSVFPVFSRRAAMMGADAIVVFSDASFARRMGTAELHLRIARFRAAETGLPLVFASASGPSAVVTGTGAIVERAARGRPAWFVAPLPAPRGRTPYVRFGDWLPACALGLSAILLLAARPRPAVTPSRGRSLPTKPSTRRNVRRPRTSAPS